SRLANRRSDTEDASNGADDASPPTADSFWRKLSGHRSKTVADHESHRTQRDASGGRFDVATIKGQIDSRVDFHCGAGLQQRGVLADIGRAVAAGVAGFDS